MRIRRMTGSIGGRWPRRCPVDDEPVSPSPEPRGGTTWQNGLTVGLSYSSASMHHEGARWPIERRWDGGSRRRGDGSVTIACDRDQMVIGVCPRGQREYQRPEFFEGGEDGLCRRPSSRYPISASHDCRSSAGHVGNTRGEGCALGRYTHGGHQPSEGEIAPPIPRDRTRSSRGRLWPPSRPLRRSAPLAEGQVGPDARVIGGPQGGVGGTGGVETHAAGPHGQRARHPNIVNTAIEPGPIGMRHGAIGVL
jgi:hypothetical protein